MSLWHRFHQEDLANLWNEEFMVVTQHPKTFEKLILWNLHIFHFQTYVRPKRIRSKLPFTLAFERERERERERDKEKERERER